MHRMLRDYECRVSVEPLPHRVGRRAARQQILRFAIKRIEFRSVNCLDQGLLGREMAIERAYADLRGARDRLP